MDDERMPDVGDDEDDEPTIDTMVEALVNAVRASHWDEDVPRTGEAEFELASTIVSERGEALSSEEMNALLASGREEAMTKVKPGPVGSHVVEGMMEAAHRARSHYEPDIDDPNFGDSDYDESDLSDDKDVLLDVLALGLVRRARLAQSEE